MFTPLSGISHPPWSFLVHFASISEIHLLVKNDWNFYLLWKGLWVLIIYSSKPKIHSHILKKPIFLVTIAFSWSKCETTKLLAPSLNGQIFKVLWFWWHFRGALISSSIEILWPLFAFKPYLGFSFEIFWWFRIFSQSWSHVGTYYPKSSHILLNFKGDSKILL